MHKTLLLGLLSSLVPACGDASMGDLDESATDGSEDESTGDEYRPCDLETHACISKVPAGWAGPIARTTADPGVACQGRYATVSIETYEEIFASSAICACECGDPIGGDCENALSFELYPIDTSANASDCDAMYEGQAQSVHVDLEWGYPEVAAGFDTRIIAHEPDVTTPGGCTPRVEGTVLPEPERTGVLQACEPSEPLFSCDEETICIPKTDAIFDSGLCIWMEGDVECPEDSEYATREVRQRGFVDTRACTPCECGAASGQSCAEAEVILSREFSSPRSLPADGVCRIATLGGVDEWVSIGYEPGVPRGGSCLAEGNEAYGDVAPETTITFCCA